MKELEEENRRLRMENEFLRRPRPSRPDASVAERCALIEAEKAPTRSPGCAGCLMWPVQLLRLAGPDRDPERGPPTRAAGHVQRVFDDSRLGVRA